MSDAIRNVLIRISIENGNMQVGPIDTSAIMQSIASIHAAMRGAMVPDVSAAQSAASEIRSTFEAITAAAGNIQVDRESSAPAAVRSPSQIMAGRKSAADARNNPSNNFEQSSSQAAAASNNAAASAVRFAKSLALVAASGTEGSDALVKQIAAMQGYFDVLSGGLQTMQKFQAMQSAHNALQKAQGTMQTARGASAVAGTAGSAAASAAGGAAASGGAGMAGAAAALANPVTLAIAAVAAGLIALKIYYDDAIALNKIFWKSMSENAERESNKASAAVIRHGEQMKHATENMPNIRSVNRIVENIERREGDEKASRAEEDDKTLTPAQKQQRRQYRDSQSTLQEQRSAAKDDYERASQQQKKAEQTAATLSSGRDGLKPKYDAQRKAIEDERKNASVGPSKTYVNAAYGATQVMPLVGVGMALHARSLSKAENTRQEGLNEDRKSVDVSQAESGKNIQKQIEESEKNALEYSKQKTQALLQQYQAGKQILANAKDALRDEKEKMRQGDIQFGSMSLGDQQRVLRLQEKHDRIKDQQKRKDAGEDVKVEEYNQMEIQLGMSTGTVAKETIETQLQKRARDMGYRGREANVDTVAAKQSQVDDAEKNVGPETEEIKELLKKAEASTKQMATELVNEMKNTFATQELYEELKAALAQMQGENKSAQAKRARTFGN